MYAPFNDIPDHARVWIYQANRPLNSHEVQQIRQWGQPFIEKWAAHGQGLRASLEIFHDHFLVIALDEQHHAASGCSIDSSVGFIRALQEAFDETGQPVDFFDRTLIALYPQQSVTLLPLAQVKKQLTEGTLSPDTLTFNNLIENKADLQHRWLIRLRDSWLARYLPEVSPS